MKDKGPRRFKKYVALGCVVFLLAALICGYEAFGVSRPSRGVAYSPLTGRVFQLKSEEIDKIEIMGERNYLTYDDREDIRVMTEYLNGYRCSYLYPKFPAEISGCGCRLIVTYTDGEKEEFQLASIGILIGDVWYLNNTEYFALPYDMAMEIRL